MTSAQIRQSFLDFFREKKHSIVPSSSLLPDAPNLLFTNAGMNQFVPIFLGQQKPQWNPPRVADTQKCIRAGGKHNDLEDVGLDTYHHTFFEMLGNWSFGDYFKKEAIEWAWELVVERWKFPAQRLYATVYKPGPNDPSEFDQEACDHWARLFRDADLDPKIHVAGFGKADNFWMMGDTGPCGPCSELHVDLTPDGDTRGALVNKNDPRCIEIWNLVFIQFNANPDGTFTPLPQRHVDTGMGFERATAIIQGTKNLTDFSGTVSNYETDIFRPIFDEIEKLSGKKYRSSLPHSSDWGAHAPWRAVVGASPTASGEAPDATPEAGVLPRTEQEKIDIAFRVVADHIRALSFAIADGIIPSNEGRGYVLRRILRRAVRYGRSLGFHEPFFFKLVDVVAKTMGDVFPELGKKQKHVEETIKREEESFNKTLDKGIELFDREATGGKSEISGVFAFRLYDEQGFPLDLTQLMARERGLTVDGAGFEKLMDEQRERARKAQKKSAITVQHIVDFPTKFVGYKALEADAKLFKIVEKAGGIGSGDKWAIVDVSPLYAESGGQVGDTGELKFIEDGKVVRVVNTLREDATFYLKLAVSEGFDWSPEAPLHLRVDADRRKLIQGHHTVTHLLHWALHQVVSKDATQKGSYVGPDKLTFDFSSAPLTPQQKRDVEKLVNDKIAQNASVSWTEIPYSDAKKHKEIQQFFGEKYGDLVRVVQIGGDPSKLDGYSMELCGGTHVRSTSEIGAFRIVKEEAIAAGTRRIEAVAGDAARTWAKDEAKRQQERFEILARKKPDVAPLPVFTDTVQTNKMLEQIDARGAHLEKLDADVREWEKQHAKQAEAEYQSRGAQIANELAAKPGKETFLVAKIQDGDSKLLQAIADSLKSKFSGPIVLAGAKDGRVALVATVPKDRTSKIQANKIIQEIAPVVGGKGGGRPENAQGGGTDASKIDEALAKARELLS
ncbi:MAG TPA: alanine--tRNA ligase [Chthoniobacterales bacterium]|jgi:alanyl-tRNA synthetase|nr:alanine--tRNA ligase [Chthoniobacterales bacterium]